MSENKTFINLGREEKNMDLKAQITEIIEKVTKDENLRQQFLKDPVKTVEGLLGVDLPDESIRKIVDGVKEKISVDKIGGILDKFGLK